MTVYKPVTVNVKKWTLPKENIMNRNIIFLLPILLITLACLGTPTIAPTNTPPPIALTFVPGAEVPPPVFPNTPANGGPASNAQPSGLKVAYVLNGNLWFWSDATPARQLTNDGDTFRLRLSDDGAVIVYQRGQSLWAINADGSSARQLVDVPAFTGRPLPGTFEFQPNSHRIYFTTRASAPEVIPTDLHRVDADAPAPQTLLTQDGGEFTFSPDGSLLALAQTDRINILRADGSGLVTAFQFQTVNTQSDWSYIPQVVWMPDSTGFYTVIPAQKSRFMYVMADGSFSAQLAEFSAADLRLSQPLISPDGSKVAYATQNGTTLDVHLIDASTADLTVASHPNAPQLGLWAWSPDSARFAYWIDPVLPLMAGFHIPSTPLVDSITPYSLTWVAPDKFIYLRNGELRLGQLSNPALTVIAAGFSPTDDARVYDFAP